MFFAAASLVLACVGGGTAIKPDSATVRGQTSGSYDYGRGQYDGSFSGTIDGTRAQQYADQVDVELVGDGGRIRLPQVVLPIVRGGKDGWFELRDLKVSERTIEAKAGVNFMNKPRVHIDRVTGTISINGKAGTYTGRCQKVEQSAAPQF